MAIYNWIVIILASILFVKEGHGYGVDSRLVIDLIQSVAFDLGNVMQVPGSNSKGPALLFADDDESRHLNVSEADFERAQRLLLNANEYTIMGTFKQTSKSTGSLVSISAGNKKFMEVMISSKKDELRFFYTNQNKIYSEIVEQEFEVEKWHKVALSISGSHVTLYVNCEKVGERRILIPDTDLRDKGLDIWLGQRGPSKLLFAGVVQQVKIVVTNHGFLHQCPELDRSCPTCGEYLSMVGVVTDLQTIVTKLEHQLAVAENRMSSLEKCGCVQTCTINDVVYAHGETWLDTCNNCTCMEGKVTCVPQICPKPNCKNPVKKPGQCCRICKDNCIYSGSTYDHLERVARTRGSSCLEMECMDGSMITAARKTPCPQDTCDAENVIAQTSNCCTYCRGHDYCATVKCPSNMVCYNMDFGHMCSCPDGHRQEGESCIEINECKKRGGDGNHCHKGTVCINTVGSYRCQCLTGYQRLDNYRCTEIDECEQPGACGRNSICTNTDASFSCECEAGYEGDGIICLPVCSPSCKNGGRCNSPGACVCPAGFKGDQCQTDIDECKGNHGCRGKSFCVNLPGSYYCHCNQGYTSPPDNNNGATCSDINECENGGHTCPSGTTCHNERGTYSCQCTNSESCSSSCVYGGQKFKDQASWMPDTCHSCICENGVATCSKIICDCSSSNVDLNCCHECAANGKCLHQELGIIYEHDDSWQYACQKCKCQNGTIFCTNKNCPRLTCENTYTPFGKCCPICQVHDQCSSVESKSMGTANCEQDLASYEHGQRWFLDNDNCSECICMDGDVCCMYSSVCTP